MIIITKEIQGHSRRKEMLRELPYDQRRCETGSFVGENKQLNFKPVYVKYFNL